MASPWLRCQQQEGHRQNTAQSLPCSASLPRRTLSPRSAVSSCTKVGNAKVHTPTCADRLVSHRHEALRRSPTFRPARLASFGLEVSFKGWPWASKRIVAVASAICWKRLERFWPDLPFAESFFFDARVPARAAPLGHKALRREHNYGGHFAIAARLGLPGALNE